MILAAYSFPSILICIPAGLLIDRFGIRVMILWFTSFSTIGMTLFALSVPLRDAKMALVGRMLFGIGAEAQNVWLATVISIWFHFGEMAFATALVTCFGKGGSIASS